MDAASLLIYSCIILISITIHEFAHAKTADVLGDPSARQSGRLTLNPFAHVDIIGFIALLLVGIGWAKPVPVNSYNFRNPRFGMLLVGLAGPISNLLLAILCIIIFKNAIPANAMLISILAYAARINVSLMVFNLLPIPPLDGSHIFSSFLPYEWQTYLEQYGFMIIILAIMFPPVQIFISSAIDFVYKFLLGVV